MLNSYVRTNSRRVILTFGKYTNAYNIGLYIYKKYIWSSPAFKTSESFIISDEINDTCCHRNIQGRRAFDVCQRFVDVVLKHNNNFIVPTTMCTILISQNTSNRYVLSAKRTHVNACEIYIYRHNL